MTNPEELKLFEKKGAEFKIKATGEEITLDWLKKIVSIYQERLKKLSEISELTEFFFKDKLEYEKDLLRWPRPEASARGREIVAEPSAHRLPPNSVLPHSTTDKEIKIALDRLEKILSKIEAGDFDKENLERRLLPEAEEFAKKFGKAGDRGYLLWPLRVALTGKEASAGPFEIAEILGKEKTLKRIRETKRLIK